MRKVKRDRTESILTITIICGSRNFKKERSADTKYNRCCHKGKVKLPKPVDENGNMLEYPSFSQSLLSDLTNDNHEKFRKHIRPYNSSVSFASMCPERDIRIYPRNPTNENWQFINVNILSPNLDPMT